MSTTPPVPSWCRVRRGAGNLLLVAPHGGARCGEPPPGRDLKVNDLHTAALAEELAAGLDASLIANPLIDRNQLDLNRIAQVTRHAPWFPALLEELIAAILARHPRAEVLFLHGWNTTQAKCDIGVGHPLRDEADAALYAAVLTASPGYVASRLARFRDACAGRGIAALLGERYPARHANNVLQLFRRHPGPAPPLAPRLRDWAVADRLEAVQLELGAPLRWPGPLRGDFAAALRESFAVAPVPGRSASGTRVGAVASSVPATLQAYDPAADVGVVARVDPAAAGARRAGRLLLFLGGTRVALFTGEDAPGAAPRDGVRFMRRPDGLHLTFDGWALRTEDGSHYLDLELALARSHLLAVRADLRFTRQRGDHGRARGTLTLDGNARAFDGVGFTPPVAPSGRDAPWRTPLSLHVGFDDTAVAVRHRVPGGTVVRDLGAAPRAASALAISFDGDPHAPGRIVVADSAGELVATPIGRLAIVRSLAPGRRARVTFGVARVQRAGASGYGFYEYARVLD
ncbi:MAG: hypothetical protein U0802_16395 [Candidatus Binatia bacterium]